LHTKIAKASEKLNQNQTHGVNFKVQFLFHYNYLPLIVSLKDSRAAHYRTTPRILGQQLQVRQKTAGQMRISPWLLNFMQVTEGHAQGSGQDLGISISELKTESGAEDNL